jgi:hypothetical protein
MLDTKSRTKYFNISKAILTRIVVITHIVFLYLSFFWQTDEVLLCTWMLIGIVFICIECVYTIAVRQGQDFKWGSPMIFIYIITAYLPCLISFHIIDFEEKLDSCETMNNQISTSSNVSNLYFELKI